MKIGLWSDSHNFPNLPLMKISAYHKLQGDKVEHYMPIDKYDLVYASKTFSFTADIEDYGIVQADKLVRGGTGYAINIVNGIEVYNKNVDVSLPSMIENIYPDYDLFPKYKFATGFLTRGCPRNCKFCVVSSKEGKCSNQVAEITDFWREQREIKLLDPNILACKDREKLLESLIQTNAFIDITQGVDVRLLDKDIIMLLNNVKMKMIHFAWDNPDDDLTDYFKLYSEYTNIKSERNKVVYVLVNFNSTLDQDLYRIYTLRDLGYSPYIMVYQKEKAPKQLRALQRWVNNKFVFRSCDRFEDYKRL